ncbi:MAG: hypothetical protein D4R80_01915, partial [Deltaproteobacteria bacterium]
ILGLIHRNAELGGMLAALGHTAVEAGDAGAVRVAVSELRRRWEEGTLEVPAGSPYTVASAVRQLVEIAGSRDPESGEA